MNEFSLVSRILGSLFYREPGDPVLEPLLSLLKSNQLEQQWPFEQAALIERLQRALDLDSMQQDYTDLFMAPNFAVSPFGKDYITGEHPDFEGFFQQIAMPLKQGRYDNFGLLLLAISWIEDQADDTNRDQWQTTLFDFYLLPWSDRFLGKVEAHARSEFYRTLAIITREALIAMREELDE